MKNTFAILFLIGICAGLRAQDNLVRNPGFEATQCPIYSPDPADFISPWASYAGSAPDYYEPDCGIPGDSNTTNNSQAFEGKGFLGMRAYGQVGGVFQRDYITGELKDSLRKDRLYRVTFYVKPVDIAGQTYGIDNLGMLFTDSIVDTVMNDGRIPATPQVASSSIIVNTSYWTPVCGVYRAKGGEKYITIGNFFTDNETQAVPLEGASNPQGAYYLVDLAEVVENDLPQLPPDTTLCLQGRIDIDISRPDFTYSWDIPSPFGFTGGRYVIVEPGDYSVRISSQYCSYRDTISVIPVECSDCKLYVPTAFTPNGDGKNDFFDVKVSCEEDLVSYRIQIFDRWGQKVFESTDINVSWSGDTDHLGTYTYNIQYEYRKFRKTETINKRGALILIK